MLPPVWSSRLALSISAILALAIVWLLVRALWLLIGGVSVTSAPTPPVPQIEAGSSVQGEFRWNLFGRSAPAPRQLRPASVSDSRLRLKGVVAGHNGYAIIDDPGSGEDVYRSGDPLPGGGEIESIESRWVVIVRDGQRETLELDPESAASSSGSRGGRSGVSSEEGGRPRLPGIRGFDAPEGASVASLPAAARSLGLNAGELSESISAMPVAGGGFRVRPGRNARLFSELGLQANDIVMAVNGQPLQSAQAVRGLFADVMSRGEVAITVRRDGREMTLRPDLEQVMGSLQSQ